MTKLSDKLAALRDWTAPALHERIPQGDMPGDKIQITEEHVAKANTLFPPLVNLLREEAAERRKPVVSVFGGSGVGKSEIASLLGFYLRSAGIGSYVLSGDNYPHRIPLYNDAERLRVFRVAGLKGLLAAGAYSPEVQAVLDGLWRAETDPDPAPVSEYPWLGVYQAAGRAALAEYLGTGLEQDYGELNAILDAFRKGDSPLWLKRMGRTEEERWYSAVDTESIDVLLLEWTHGGNPALTGVDVPILLNSTPEETREHRRRRARDGKTDSAFTTMVLEIEQAEIARSAGRAKLILSKAGALITAAEAEGSI
jgi:hypothetical protein